MNLSRIDLNLILTLQMLLAEKNVTKAAKRLRVSQPTVSTALARLREIFNDPLLARVGRGYELTPLAVRLQLEVDEAIGALEDVFASRQDADIHQQKRTYRIAARDYMSYLLLPRLVSHLAEVAPDVTVCFSRVDAESLDKLASGALDFIVMPNLSEHSFPSRILFEDDWVCAAWAHNQKVDETISEAEYLAQDHVIFLPGPGKRIAQTPRVSTTSTRRHALASVDDFALIPFFLRQSELVAVLPGHYARAVQQLAELKLLPPPDDLQPLTQTICWNPRSNHDPAHQWMLDQVEFVVQKL